MNYEVFKALYETQISIGNSIEILTLNQYDSFLLKDLIKMADDIGNRIRTGDNHWLLKPVPLLDAWLHYNDVKTMEHE